MSSNLQCPHCGWQYDPADYSTPGDDGRSFSLVPAHADIPTAMVHDIRVDCPGTEQHPRNPESDRRPLWNGNSPPLSPGGPANGRRA